MAKTILITGGAGFIGSHLADELLAHGYHVRALDNLAPQVHGEGASWPAYCNPEVEAIVGDVCDEAVLKRALDGVDAVFHLAALIGVGQSMYQIARYTEVNNLGTALLLEQLVERPVERLIVASSMSVYGEGPYRNAQGETVQVEARRREQLRERRWEHYDADGQPLTPLPTPESKPPALASVYALSKYDQEQLCHMVGAAYDIPTVALRFFNIYGTRQALSNPYTGVLAIFASRFLNDRPPLIFEDGEQRRDFVSIYDITQACRLALELPAAVGKTFNVASGQTVTIREVAERMARALGKEQIVPEVTGEYRVGDVRHCFADIALARELLGYEPRVTLEEGLVELAEWLEGQVAVDRVGEMRAELASRGLTV